MYNIKIYNAHVNYIGDNESGLSQKSKKINLSRILCCLRLRCNHANSLLQNRIKGFIKSSSQLGR